MQSFTKVVATVGPSLESPDLIKKAIRAGVNIFRFNFKHNSIEWHSRMIETVNGVSRVLGVRVGTLIDLQGPEIRILMREDQMMLKKDERISFGPVALKNKKKGFSITHPHIIKYLHTGQRVIADDGAFRFTVEHTGSNIVLRAENGGVLKNRKTLNIPGASFPFPTLVDRDFEGLEFAALKQVDYVALSFVRTASDIDNLKREMKKYRVPAKIVAKIETEKALKHLDEIIEVSDAVMVARGDLGVEAPIEEVPYHQKAIIKKCILAGKPVITATQMLESMIWNSYPTRAEISDIANATYDLTDAVMLSAETATGKHPIEAIEYMKKTVQFNEKQNRVDSRKRFNFSLPDQRSLLCDTAYGLYLNLRNLEKSIAGFVVFTQLGKKVRLLSRYRPLSPIFAFAKNRQLGDSLLIHFGVIPFVAGHETTEEVIDQLRKKRLVKKGELLIVLQTATLQLVTV